MYHSSSISFVLYRHFPLIKSSLDLHMSLYMFEKTSQIEYCRLLCSSLTALHPLLAARSRPGRLSIVQKLATKIVPWSFKKVIDCVVTKSYRLHDSCWTYFIVRKIEIFPCVVRRDCTKQLSAPHRSLLYY